MSTLSKAQRDELVVAHLGYAKSLARELVREFGSAPGFDDMDAAAQKGLFEAAERFDPTRGASFKTFSYYRIRGSVLDLLRAYYQQNPWKRASKALLRAAAAVDDVVEHHLGARPSAPKGSLEDAADALADVLDDVVTSYAVAEASRALMAEEDPDATPEHNVATRQLLAQLEPVIQGLPERERTMLRGVYFDGSTIEDAGKTMGLSKSWASRLHARALKLLKEQVAALPA